MKYSVCLVNKSGGGGVLGSLILLDSMFFKGKRVQMCKFTMYIVDDNNRIF